MIARRLLEWSQTRGNFVLDQAKFQTAGCWLELANAIDSSPSSALQSRCNSTEPADRKGSSGICGASTAQFITATANREDTSGASGQQGDFAIESIPSAEEGLQRSKAARFIDKLRITAQAGRGGNGCQSKWASKAKGKFRPPDGGNGGKGGDVILRACQETRSLSGLNYLHKAMAGGHGGNRKLAGSQGKDCIVQVPPGTVVYLPDGHVQGEDQSSMHELPYWLRNPGKPWVGALDYTSDEDTDPTTPEISSEATQKGKLGEEIADLKSHGDQILLAKGGEGGKGNAFHSTSVRKSKDLSSLRGSAGERVTAYLEMRMIADIGLVGAPNAGKSSLLKILSKADPKVASYPFTTLQPQLGVVRVNPFLTLTMADIPGLIPGAARNRGLGHAFLRHISRARALIYILDSSSGLGETPGLRPWEQLAALQAELHAYSKELAEKPAIVVANKVDKLKNREDTLAALRRQCNLPFVAVSALPDVVGFDAAAVENLKQQLSDLLRENKA